MLLGFKTSVDGEWNAASAICTFAYFPGGRDGDVHIIQGITRGHIVEPRGTSGFGFDSCFVPIEVEPTDVGLTYA